MVTADREQPDRRLRLELPFVEFHIGNDLAAIVERRVHTTLARIGKRVGSCVLRIDRARLEDLVPEPPSDIDVFLAFGKLGRQIRKLLKDKIPLPLYSRRARRSRSA